LLKCAVVPLNIQAQIPDDLAEERPDYDVGTVIGNHDDPALRIAEYIVTPLPSDPQEAACLGHFAQLSVGHETQSCHAATSIRHVPTKSG